jgi:DNA-binding LacI/PurR family transcriptional regulator
MNGSIIKELIARIDDGKLLVGERIPTEMELARRHGTTRMNVHFAVNELKRLGIVSRNKKGGTVLIRKPEPHMRRELESIASKRVCVIASMDKSMPHFHWDLSTLRGMGRRLEELGYRMVHLEVPAQPTLADLKSTLASAVDGGCFAIILMPELEEMRLYQAHVETLYQFHDNIYVFNRIGADLRDLPFHVIEFDTFGEGALAAQHMHALGIRRVVTWIESSVAGDWARRRVMGLKAGLYRLSEGAVAPEVIYCEQWSAVDPVRDRIAASKEYCGVVALNDARASVLLEKLAERGLKAPDDFSLVSFDADSRFASLNLTTITPPVDRLGELITQFVSQRASFVYGNILHLKLASRIVAGNTCRHSPDLATVVS